MAEGIEHRAKALQGDKEAAQRALESFQRAHHELPGDHKVMAYYADCLSLQAKEQDQPSQMFGNAIQAIKMLDAAANGSPDDIEIRRLRAEHSMRLPEPFFRRTATAITDYEYLLGRYETDRSLFSKEDYWEMLYQLGSAYQRMGMEKEAGATWKKLLSSKPDSKYEKLVSQQYLGNISQLKRNHIALRRREDILKEGIRLHDLGVKGNRQAVQLAFGLLQKAHEKKPDDPLALAYYGSAMALKGRDANEAQDIFTHVFQGLKLLKQAVAKDPHNPRIRLLRGYVYYNLPENYFHMTEKAVKDLRYVKTAWEADNSLFPKETYQQVVRDLAQALRRTGDHERADKLESKAQKKA